MYSSVWNFFSSDSEALCGFCQYAAFCQNGWCLTRAAVVALYCIMASRSQDFDARQQATDSIEVRVSLCCPCCEATWRQLAACAPREGRACLRFRGADACVLERSGECRGEVPRESARMQCILGFPDRRTLAQLLICSEEFHAVAMVISRTERE
jgi:hypothetical protein